MSLNSTVLTEDFVPLPMNSQEKFVFTAEHVAFSFLCGNGYPGASLSYHSESGKLYLSSFRLVYVSLPQLPVFQSFSCPYNHLKNPSLKPRSSLNWSIFGSDSAGGVITATIIPQFELQDHIQRRTALKISFPRYSTATKCLELLKDDLLFDGPTPPLMSHEPLPKYTPPEGQLPSYDEIVNSPATADNHDSDHDDDHQGSENAGGQSSRNEQNLPLLSQPQQ